MKENTIVADVFSNTDLVLPNKENIFPGNLYCAGNLVEPLIPVDVQDNCSIEVFGDLIVDNILYLQTIIVHGNVICQGISCTKLIVDGDINILESDKDSLHNELSATTVLCGGNIVIAGLLWADSVGCFGSISATSIDVDEILCGTTVFSKEDISFSNLLSADVIKANGDILLELCEASGKICARVVSTSNLQINV